MAAISGGVTLLVEEASIYEEPNASIISSEELYCDIGYA
jgi:hypothetical protein